MNQELRTPARGGDSRTTGLDVFWLSVFALAAINLFGFWIGFLGLPESGRIRYIPDDTYYYLTLARNFAESGSWTFDGGQTVTSGFHLLWAYLLLTLFEVLPLSESGFVTASVVLGFVLLLVPVGLVLAGWRRSGSWVIPAAGAVLLTSVNFVLNSVTGLEWPLVLLAGSLYVWVSYRYSREPGRRTALVLLFGLGLLGSLARSDFGLLPLGIVLAAGVVDLVDRRLRHLVQAGAGLLGAVTGVGLGMLHNLAFTGEWLQSSSRTKAFWGEVYGYDPLPSIKWAVKLILPAGSSRTLTVVFAAALAIVIGGLAWQGRHRLLSWTTSPRPALLLALGSGLTVICAFLFYGFNSSACQFWYTANLVVPAGVGLALVLRALGAGRRARLALSAVLFALVITKLGLLHLRPPEGMVHQERILVAGRYLRSQGLRSVGAWNAGIIGYYQGGTVVNLDGLVNNEVYPYLLAGKLRDYVTLKKIRYIVDFESMFEHERLRRRGGYADGRLQADLRRIRAFPGSTDEGWPDVVLWEIVPERKRAPASFEIPRP